ncbi:hypothetical protein GGX14DRAFT_474749 [Mycena pura]|uniref:Telomere-associated protein Rif1 N-terminal domain-containing protein n=1 Tax=Mycena pura TaxID=153505 RepID=A0AAD6UUW3_9AGAR|nr:hypothetical protein GGX14DRAFT_474749 [Mycena pura]
MTPDTVQKENCPAKQPYVTETQETKLQSRQAKVASAPLKPIFENNPGPSPIPPSPAYMPPAAGPSSELPNEFLASPAYFMSPVTTVLESAGQGANDISVHDLIEAYNMISNRIRSQIRVILADEAPRPALVPLQECSRQLGEALRRDLKRVREEPFFDARRTSSIEGSFQRSISMNEEETRVSRDLALLAHQVLRLISEIFAFSPLYSIFSTNDLRSILNELLALGLAPFIPDPTSRRTWTLVVWVLSVQDLPSAVLLPAIRQIVSVLKRAMEGRIGKDQAKLDSFKASSQLLKQYPSLFISPLLDIFPCLLQHLVADSSIIRVQAVNALGRFALAKTSTLLTANSCHAAFRDALSAFITPQLKSGQPARLRNFVTAALLSANPAHPAHSPFWVVQLLASCVVLLDYSFFSNPRALKLTLQSLEQLAGHKQKLVSALHPYLWKCLIWVFTRLPAQNEGDDIRDSVFMILKQDLRGDIGLALVISLLGTIPGDHTRDTSDSVSKVLKVVGDMVASNKLLLQAEGIALLTKLLYGPTLPTMLASAQHLDLLVPQLFDGSLVQSKPDNVISTIRSLGRLDINQVRQLSDAEILHHWDALADLWGRATKASLSPEFDTIKLDPPHLSMTEYRQNLLHGWQSLLLSPSDLTQGYAHLTTPAPFSGKITALLCSFNVPAESADAQVRQLRLISSMWHTMTNVFQPDKLAAPAETILGAVLKQRYELTNESVRCMWAELCHELMSLGLASSVDVVRAQGGAQTPTDVQRHLWISAAKSCGKSRNPASWMDLAYLLSIPLGVWSMTPEEGEIWEKLLRTALASDKTVRPTMVVEHVLENVKEGRRCSESPEEFLTLLSYFDFDGRTVLPEGVFSIVANAVDILYPHKVSVPTSLQLIRRLRDIIQSAPLVLALPLLLALQNSVCKWLEDDQNVLVGDVRKEVIQCLFLAPLSAIQDLEPSGETLVSISPFLATVADPDAFERFWRVTYHNRDEFYEFYPENLKTSLRAFADIFGGSLAGALARENHSQMESSCALDSQPSRAVPSSSLDYYADVSRYPLDADAIGMDHTSLMANENTVSTVQGPPPPSILQAVPRDQLKPIPSAALEQLQEYSSRLDESNVLDLSSRESLPVSFHSAGIIHGDTPRYSSQQNSRALSERPSLKRGIAVDDAPILKRRKTSPSSASFNNAIASSSRRAGGSISEPASRREPVVLSGHAVSEASVSLKRKGKRRLILDYVDVPPFEGSRKRREVNSLPTPSPSLRQHPAHQPKTPPGDEEDYASWEAGLSISDLEHVQHMSGDVIETCTPPITKARRR